MTPARVRVARLIAVGADFLQIIVFPLFLPGLASPWNNALDVLVAVSMVALVGWHWAFLPSFLAELVPVVGLVPTWTAAVFFATRGQGGPATPPGAIDTEVVSSTRTAPPSP